MLMWVDMEGGARGSAGNARLIGCYHCLKVHERSEMSPYASVRPFPAHAGLCGAQNRCFGGRSPPIRANANTLGHVEASSSTSSRGGGFSEVLDPTGKRYHRDVVRKLVLVALAAGACKASPSPVPPETATTPSTRETDKQGRLLALCRAGVDDACSELGIRRAEPSAEPDRVAQAEQEDDVPQAPHSTSEPSTVPSKMYVDATNDELEAACGREDPTACSVLGSRVLSASVRLADETLSAEGIETTMEAAQPYLRRACDLGDAESCPFVLLEEGFLCTTPERPTRGADQTIFLRGFCAKSAYTCDVIRETLVEVGWASVPHCVPRRRAACYSHTVVLDKQEVRSCFASFDECESQRALTVESGKRSRDVAGVTACKVVE